jgi:hypothetical protein
MREFRTSGSVGGREGNLPAYPTPSSHIGVSGRNAGQFGEDRIGRNHVPRPSYARAGDFWGESHFFVRFLDGRSQATWAATIFSGYVLEPVRFDRTEAPLP